MKKLSKILTFLLVLTMLFTMTSCNELIIDGSKITKVTMTLDFYGADGKVASTSKVKMHLYYNNAPKTVSHVKKLINKGYYNGVCINNISPYFVELGEYHYDSDGNFAKKAYNYGKVEGEFDLNGFQGQNQPINAGAIVLKRDRGNGADNHNSATCGLYFMTMGTTDITEKDYAFVGRVLDDDGGSETTSSSSVDNVDDIDRSKYSSFKIIKTLTDLGVKSVTEESVKTETTEYYNSKTGDWYKKVVVTDTNNNESETTVSKLNNVTNEYEALSSLEQEEFLALFNLTGSGFSDEYYDYFRVPFQKIIVRKMAITE